MNDRGQKREARTVSSRQNEFGRKEAQKTRKVIKSKGRRRKA